MTGAHVTVWSSQLVSSALKYATTCAISPPYISHTPLTLGLVAWHQAHLGRHVARALLALLVLLAAAHVHVLTAFVQL